MSFCYWLCLQLFLVCYGFKYLGSWVNFNNGMPLEIRPVSLQLADASMVWVVSWEETSRPDTPNPPVQDTHPTGIWYGSTDAGTITRQDERAQGWILSGESLHFWRCTSQGALGEEDKSRGVHVHDCSRYWEPHTSWGFSVLDMLPWSRSGSFLSRSFLRDFTAREDKADPDWDSKLEVCRK